MGGLRGLGERVKPDTSDPRRRTRLTALIFSLRAGSAGRDAGLVLPKITDEFAGRAPDFGAFETGTPTIPLRSPDDFIRSSVSGGSNPFQMFHVLFVFAHELDEFRVGMQFKCFSNGPRPRVGFRIVNRNLIV